MAALAVLEANLTSLAFNSPVAGLNGSDPVRYDAGQLVNVSWTTPYEYTTLELWQGPNEEGSFALDVLAANFTQNVTSFMWNATASEGDESMQRSFLRLQKGDLPNTCDRCTADSAIFRVSDPTARTSCSSSSATPSTVAPTPAAAVATSSVPSSYSHSGISERARLGIGLGVGLGVGALMIILGILLFGLNRRKKRRQAHQHTYGQPDAVRNSLASAGADSWMSKHSSKMSYHSRFEFETPDGSVKEGSEALWPRTEKPSWLQRAPSKPKNPFFRS
ncbi:hypothetical protein M409DRAFT_15933 [Zasmidium cellare ATCC 36951]|uniref:Mid2 domain-containing protein n=1 Tax=Zasmidium cellare ATCC 36951 TaxID=1080233 RepID=A0A6A6D3M6_ZASCE|nr:uncharacterized protein M409DRAFT_15933 [Zasmidium cellare ATCC 36951]KAF2173655.1 hypothetical protein M409DRAFT_15933 [Zasmidium cellare ATCC 36951]